MESSRATLRRFNVNDFENMRKLESDPDIMRFTPSRVSLSPEQTRDRLQKLIESETVYQPLGVWAAELKGSRDFVGWFMIRPTDLLWPELGFMIVKGLWGLGLATEIAKVLIQFAGSLGHQKLMARTDIDNHVSIKVLSKLGFRFIESKIDLDPILKKDLETNYYVRDLK